MKIRVIYCLFRSLFGGGVVEGAPPEWDREMPWRDGRRVSGAVSGALQSGVPPPAGARTGGGGIWKRTGWAPLLTGRGGDLCRLPTEDG